MVEVYKWSFIQATDSILLKSLKCMMYAKMKSKSEKKTNIEIYVHGINMDDMLCKMWMLYIMYVIDGRENDEENI